MVSLLGFLATGLHIIYFYKIFLFLSYVYVNVCVM
jgi:hypothetical protein